MDESASFSDKEAGGTRARRESSKLLQKTMEEDQEKEGCESCKQSGNSYVWF